MTTKKEFDVTQLSFDREGKKLSFETWKLAVQADSSINLVFQENVLLCSTCMEKKPRPDSDFLPLMLDIRESFSAAGRIWWAAYRRREGRPSDQAVLYARLTDRALRPMFPKWMINDVVITITPLAIDHTMDLWVATIIWSSLSIMAAGIPFDGPVWAAKIWYKDGKFLINPTKEELKDSMFDLLVAGKKWTINMIESEASEVPEDILRKAFEIWQEQINKSCDFQTEFLKKLTIHNKEIAYNKPSEELMAYISNILTADKLEAMTGNSKVPFNELYSQYEKEVLEIAKEKISDPEQKDFSESKIKIWVFNTIKYFIRSRTLETWKRIDDRKQVDIRPLFCEVGMIPRVHGTWLFRRWDTQVLTTVTLGSPWDFLIFDDMENDGVKQRFFHHYNFPPFSVGEAKGMRWTGRREIWHGRLAEKALEKMIPTKEEFPYIIRLVSECLWSWWSTSMGSVCGSTLSLMDAWVPIKKPVAGIAMWLMTDHDDAWNITKHMVLNDLMWTEDFTWDMDFKVAGTRDGITAIQLDTKLKGITMDIIQETITRAISWYNEIMDFMLQTIDKPRDHVATYAPKIFSIKVPMAKVKEVIGKWWDVINKMIEECGGIKIDFEEDGTCYLTHQDQAMIDKALAMIKEIITDLEAGQEFDAKITRVEDYWLFVQLPKNKMWLCHISNLGQRYETPLTNHFKIWERIRVKIKWIDHDWKVAVVKI